MKVLVTGGAGFIGSHIVDRLVELNHDVIVLDNLSTGLKKNINPEAEFYEVDICDIKKIRDIFLKEKPDIVSHHAAQMNVRVSVKKPINDAYSNIIGSINIIKNCIKNNIKKVIYASSGGAIYGEVNRDNLPIKETEQINPISPYGVSKYAIEKYLFSYNYNYNLNYTILRYGNVYGERQNPKGEAGVIALFLQKMLNNFRPIIFGDGLQTRDYIYVKDIVDVNIDSLEKGNNDIYNVGLSKEIPIKQLFDTLKKNLNFNQEPIYEKEQLGEIKFNCLDSSKIQDDFNWKPKFDFENGIKKTIDYYKNER